MHDRLLDKTVHKFVHHVLSEGKHALVERARPPPERALAKAWCDEMFESVFELFEPQEAELDATWLILDKDSAMTERMRLRRDVVVMDCAKMHQDLHCRKDPLGLILEAGRNVLVHAMVKGKLLVMKLGSSCCDFLHTFHDGNDSNAKDNHTGLPLSKLPFGFMLHEGKPLLRSPWPEQLIRRVDRTHNHLELTTAPAESNFQIILTTELEHDDLDDMLFDHKMGLPPKYHFKILDRGVAYNTVLNELGLVQDEEIGLI